MSRIATLGWNALAPSSAAGSSNATATSQPDRSLLLVEVREGLRETHREAAPFSDAVAVNLDHSAVELGQALHRHEAETEASRRSIQRLLPLRERLEQRLDQPRFDPVAVVFHRHCDPIVFVLLGDQEIVPPV